MSHHIKGQSRHQSTLFPESIDDFVTEDNPVRVIDMFVDQLSLLDLRELRGRELRGQCR